MGKNMKYMSEILVQEIVLALAGTVVEPIKGLQPSPVFTFLIDETTDVSVTKRMIIFCHFFDK